MWELGDPLVRGNRIRDGRSVGILVYEFGRGHFVDNEICGNKLWNIEVRRHGNPLVERNRIHSSKLGGVYMWGGGGTHKDSEVVTCTIKDNEIYSNTGPGINIGTDGRRDNNIGHHRHNTLHHHHRALQRRRGWQTSDRRKPNPRRSHGGRLRCGARVARAHRQQRNLREQGRRGGARGRRALARAEPRPRPAGEGRARVRARAGATTTNGHHRHDSSHHRHNNRALSSRTSCTTTARVTSRSAARCRTRWTRRPTPTRYIVRRCAPT